MASRSELGSEIVAAFRGNKNYQVLALMTLGIFEAARRNEVCLDSAFRQSRKDQKKLNDQLCLVLGVKQESVTGGKRKIAYTDVAALFVHNDTARTNFAHALKKCTKTAVGLLDLKAEIRLEPKAGKLVAAGPGIRGEFGLREITLDEKPREGLTQRPSYTALAAIAERNRGIVPKRGSMTRGRRAITSSDTQFESLCRELLHRLNAIGRLSTRQSHALEAVSLAIEHRAK